MIAAGPDLQDLVGRRVAMIGGAMYAELRLIRYRSVRDPDHAACAAVLDCRAFGSARSVTVRQTWFLSADVRRASWVRAGSRPSRPEALEFDYPG